METLYQWMRHRGLPCPRIDDMPAIGVVAYVDGKEVAMAFLRRVEGGFAQLDGLVTDETAPGAHRHEAIEAAVQAIVSKAKELGIKSLMATSQHKNTVMRACSLHGFTIEPTVVLSLNLSR